MSFLRPIQWYHSKADPIWWDATFNLRSITNILQQIYYSTPPPPNICQLIYVHTHGHSDNYDIFLRRLAFELIPSSLNNRA
jgi:hypothetical protein